MTWVFQEGDLEITINNAEEARKFDEQSAPKPGQMKAVDFVVKLPDRYLFIEFKDPQDPKSRPANSQDFLDDFRKARIDTDLIYKYRDSFLHEWASGRAERDITYLVLIAVDSLTTAELDIRTKALEGKLPVGTPDGWGRPMVNSCAVLNIANWNRNFPNLVVKRMSAS